MQKTCKCGKEFKTSNGSEVCYDCVLESLTQGRPPEEGDFNTASIVSGKMSEDEFRYLQEDLRNIEQGISRRDPADPENEVDYDSGRYLGWW